MSNEVYETKTERLIILNRALKPAKLTVGKFTDLDLRTFILVGLKYLKNKLKVILVLGNEKCVFISRLCK